MELTIKGHSVIIECTTAGWIGHVDSIGNFRALNMNDVIEMIKTAVHTCEQKGVL